MLYFKRAFFIALAVTLLLFVLVFGFELINASIEKSGFSSGEVSSFSFSDGVLAGEIMGEKFSVDFSSIGNVLSKTKFLIWLLPPFLRVLFFIF